MSKLETPMIRRWWSGVGGRICEEYPIVAPRKGIQTRRRVDALVRRDLPTEWVDYRAFGTVAGADVIVVQAKASGLSFPLMGQAVFSADLARSQLQASTARSVLICTASHRELEPLLEPFDVELVLQPDAGSHRPYRLPNDPEALARVHASLGGHIYRDVAINHRRSRTDALRAHAVVFFDGPWDGGTMRDRDLLHVTVTGRKSPAFGMFALGQALFGAELLRRVHQPARVRSMIVARGPDAAMATLASRHGVELFVASRCPR